ncbi:ParB/RepB/Spo0J family partition protein [Klenkia brasiliensis]|uniref:ParB/RepB/Spo0J family partition protein n=1 Tax=Klenkia brasiliensis TaxID=333142 RepID=UPI0013F697A4|nr:ParB N-terminal domain-containing protein [Klenkia brasiliensis]
MSDLLHVDPALLLVDLNVRHDARLDADFKASVAEHGVLVPVVVVRTHEDRLRVRFGHRRTLAAVEVGRPTVPVVVVADETTDDAATVERLVTQWAENEHRTGLTTAERADVIGQLSAFGVSPTQIARRTRATKTEVTAALAVHRSELARAATARYKFLDLTQAAVVAEFDADTEAVKALVLAAREGRFDHVAQRLRDDRREAAARSGLADQLREQGVRVIDRPASGDTAAELHRLADDEGTRLTAATHECCPGHAAYIGQEHGWVIVDADGQPLGEASDGDGEDEVDLDDEDDPEDGGEAPRREWSSWAAPRWVCTDPAAHGHTDTWAATSSGNSGRVPADQLTDDEREAARVARRDVIESNKAWGSAQTVRREWLRDLACRKTAPKGTAGFLAASLAVDADLLADVGGNHLAADLLGIETGSYGRSAELARLVAAAVDARALLLALVQVLAAYEARADRNDWRHLRPATGRYLTHLQALGYTLADVEHRACGHDPAPTTDSDQDD